MIKFITKMYKKFESLILYGIFGVLTTVLNIATFELCYHPLGINLLFSNVIAWIAGVIFAYVTNKTIVFKSKRNQKGEVIAEMISFVLCRLFTLGLDTLIMFIFIDKLHFNDLLIKIVSNVVVIVFNYVFSKLVIFRKKSDSKDDKKEESSIKKSLS